MGSVVISDKGIIADRVQIDLRMKPTDKRSSAGLGFTKDFCYLATYASPVSESKNTGLFT